MTSSRAQACPSRPSTDALTEADKQRLLGFLKASHGTVEPERKKITLTKKSTSEIKQADATGRARTIQVEVRKKRTFIQRDEGHPAVPEATPPPRPRLRSPPRPPRRRSTKPNSPAARKKRAARPS